MSSFLEILSRYKPTTRFGRFAALVAVGYLLLKLLELFFRPPGAGLLDFLLGVALFVVVVRYLLKGTRSLLDKLLWRLRHRLLVTYFLIGIVPVFLLLLIMLISGYLTFGNLARFFASDGLDHLSADLETATRATLIPMLDTLARTPDPQTEDWPRLLAPLLESLESRFSKVWIDAESDGRRIALQFTQGQLSLHPDHFSKPAWLKADTTGIFDDQARLYLVSFVARATPPYPGWLLLRAPLDSGAFNYVSERTQVSISIGGALIPSPRGDFTLSEGSDSKKYEVKDWPVDQNAQRRYTVPLASFDFPIGFKHLLRTQLWQEGESSGDKTSIYYLNVDSTWYRLARRLFAMGLGLEGIFSAVVLILACVIFLVIEIMALISALLMTRTITRAVYHLDKGAKHILQGDFSYRIPVKSHDQLSSLGDTFNSMAASMERLLREEAEKQRLDSELAVAREVQQHLFPRELPRLSRLHIAGKCHPAHTVSGDYYDYFVIAPGTLSIALGDVSGKGVSAALLMASLQAALHSHLSRVSGRLAQTAIEQYAHAGRSEVAVSTQVAEVVSLLNQQLYENTPMEKYATFFYAVYEEPSAQLTYTNAGHLSPLVFTANGVRRLETGGTVVGLFPDVDYEQGVIHFAPSDVMVIYTDGITEAENPSGEQFGEARLIDVATRARTKPPDRIVADVLRAVHDWIESGEPQDDVTLIVTKAI